MNKKLGLSLAVGLAFSGIALFFSFRNIPMQDLARYMGSVNYLVLIPGAIVALLSFILRVVRWKWILRSTKKVPFFGIYHPMIIGFMLNCILPLRAGEFARPAILLKREKIPYSKGLASIACERLFDLVTLLTFLLVTLAIIDIDPEFTVSFGSYTLTGAILTRLAYGMMKLGVALILGIILISIKPVREVLADLIMAIPQRIVFLPENKRETLKDRVFRPLSEMIDHFADGLILLKSPVNILVCIGISVGIWVVQAVSYHFMTLACPGLELTFAQTMAMMVMICFFIALPSVPGYWGIWEAGGMFALALFSVAREQAAGYTLINHVVQIVPVIIAGLISALMIGINFKQLYGRSNPDPDQQ